MNYLLRAGSIHVSRAVYALNWFVMAPSLSYISSDLYLNVTQLGIITAGFYAGLAVFQLIGGILASRLGNAKIAIIGLSILGGSTVITGLSPNLTIMLLSRVSAGAGAALFFSPGIGALSNIVPHEKFGTHVGIYNGAFNVGAGIGIIGWAILDKDVGWRAALVVSGLMALIMAMENAGVFRGIHEEVSSAKDIPRKIVAVSRMPDIWILSIAGFSSIIAETLIGQFFVYYGKTFVGLTTFTASLLAGVSMIVGIVGGVLAGKEIQKIPRKKLAFFSIMLTGGIVLSLIPFTRNSYLLLLILSAEGLLVVAGFSVLYTMVSMEVADRSMVSFSLALTNTIQLAFSVAVPVIFTFIVSVFNNNYTYAWVLSGVIAMGTSLIVSFRRSSDVFPSAPSKS
ncbi:MAG: MFS transporter [Thermoplasmataceae archaeon]